MLDLQGRESTGELVLVNVRSSLEPEENLDVKAWVIINHQLRLAKARLGLKRLLSLSRNSFTRERTSTFFAEALLEHALRNFREAGEREVLRFPSTQKPFARTRRRSDSSSSRIAQLKLLEYAALHLGQATGT